jgi:hypothetical protein
MDREGMKVFSARSVFLLLGAIQPLELLCCEEGEEHAAMKDAAH